MIFKIDEKTKCKFLFTPLQTICKLVNHEENLVKATVKNILISAVNQSSNQTLSPFLASFGFHQFLIGLLKELLKTTQRIERMILMPKRQKELQNCILDLEDLLEYFRDMLVSLGEKSTALFNFAEFLFQLFFLVQLLLPLLRYDLKIKSNTNIGLNCGLFVLNHLLWLFDRFADMEKRFILPLLFREKMLSPWVRSFDFNLIFESKDLVNFFYKFPNNKNDKTNNSPKKRDSRIKRVSSKDQLLSPPDVLIDINKKMVPRVFCLNEPSELADFERGSNIRHTSKTLECLGSFLKTKDDNMLLLSTNVFLLLLKNFKIKKNLMQDISERCAANLSSDVRFRLVTFENLAKLLTLTLHPDYIAPKWKIIEALKTKIQLLHQTLKSPKLARLLTTIFRQVCLKYDRGPVILEKRPLLPRDSKLNYLSLLNYSFLNASNQLKYLSLYYKYHLTDREVIETELFFFIILKNLRYVCRIFFKNYFLFSLDIIEK